MIILHRCAYCGDLCTQVIDYIYMCDRVECEAAYLFENPPIKGQ